MLVDGVTALAPIGGAFCLCSPAALRSFQCTPRGCMKSHGRLQPLRHVKACSVAALVLCSAAVRGLLGAEPAKPGGDKAAWQRHLDELSRQTEQGQRGVPMAPLGQLPQTNSTPPMSPQPAPPVPVTSSASENPAGLDLFEDDFDRAGELSYAQHRMVLLVFAPQVETDSWRSDPELHSWSRRVVICPVHEGAMGDRAQRLAKAFGLDLASGGMVTALVRAPDGAAHVRGDQLLYQVLGRHPAPRDATGVLGVLPQAVAAYDAKKTQYKWDARLAGAEMPSQPGPAPSSPIPPPAPPAVAEAKPPAPPQSPFESAVARAWRGNRPVMLIFPGSVPFEKAKCAQTWRSIPAALAPELVVLTPGSADGSVDGHPTNWEAFFDIDGRYPTALLVLPEHSSQAPAAAGPDPKASEMTYRIIARRQGGLTEEAAPVLARLWMSEDFDAVTMRAWVLRRPMVLVFPHPDHTRDLLDSPALAKLEEGAAVFVNSKDAVSGIRRRTAAQIEREFATEGVERAEVVLVKLESKVKDPASARLDQIQLSPVNRAFAKKSADKILEWVSPRLPAKP